ncbi:hypothetical protein [Ammoniphilus sp. YIM 78166]|uniref:hypothetical protein n=1 Tax=Ammoniphilus sp. YIM 78166 TaxID=1644106 RepID=UPI0010703308|nr:hypothetical protein [Ammoniphilus sp. YIM 78166]
MARKSLKGVPLLLSVLLLLTGCTIPSSKTVFSLTEQQNPNVTTMDARGLLQEAVKMTTEGHPGDKKRSNEFWYNGYIRNSIGDRKTTSMYEGILIRPSQAYLVNGRMAGIPFSYYRWEDHYYLKKGDVWFRASKDQVLPYDPFNGFLDWLPLMDNAQKLPDDAVLNTPTDVIEVRISGKEWVEKSTSPLFEELKEKIATDPSLAHVLDNSVVKTTIWIGKEDRYIYQYRTWIVMPLPGGGYVDQEVYFRFYKFGDPGIPDRVKQPEEVEKWVVEFEEKMKAGELEELQEQPPVSSD